MKVSEEELNLRVAETLWKGRQCSGQTFKDGEFVALLDGNVVAVADNPEDAISALRAIESDPQRGMVVDVSPPELDVIR